jgi:predicted transcriptional regulator
VLRRLEEKGYVTHILDNRTFLYSPAEPAPMVAGRAVKRILEWFCEGSVEQLLVGMVDSSVLDRKELQRLAERIAAAQSSQKVGGKTANTDGKGVK